MSIASVMPPNHLILCRPLLLPSVFPSIRVFSNESALCNRWPKYWSFSISPSSEYLGLIYLQIDWFDFLAVQGILRSLLQHHSSRHQFFAFFMVQVSQLYMTTGKTMLLLLLSHFSHVRLFATRWTYDQPRQHIKKQRITLLTKYLLYYFTNKVKSI